MVARERVELELRVQIQVLQVLDGALHEHLGRFGLNVPLECEFLGLLAAEDGVVHQQVVEHDPASKLPADGRVRLYVCC